ncbi:MAG: hypothetical protein JJ953_11180 [Gracilimonas sp.]|uniref:hypothetical protein n=1 Tax=Gracilimonas TaxID=649462 RepID=UPI001B1BC297|nr:hypothetical protein [Gracilimonas sp.]MBO6586659.1 hypothetical protein [Gracilimonas sp.]MBO6615316.1 hypothetical protein [Gracilimonas sp.]
MKFRYLLISLILFSVEPGEIYARQNPLTFQSQDLQLIAQRYTGSTVNWPLVIEMASHDVDKNSFTLEPSAILQLQNFAEFSSKVNEQQKRISDLINSGATVFAAEEYAAVKEIISKYSTSISEGELDQAIGYAGQLEQAVDEMETTLMNNRIVDVQAQLSRKKGEVNKRVGLLGSWSDSFIGDLFKQSDGIRTLIESYATLSFTDGSDIQVNPNTIAVIRKSRIDKLNNASDTEITLEDGGLLAKLSAAGKDRSTYVLNAGPSRTELKTQNFYAETEGVERAKLSNYDGEAIINSNDVTITIQKNQGTIVEEGKDPLQPVELLPAPELDWSSADTLINEEELLFAFREIDDAANYRVQYSNSPNFDGQLTEVTTSESAVNIENLPMGMTYVRVQATDQLGLRGPFSKTARIIRNVDNQPPPVFLDNIRGNILLTSGDTYTVEGVTEPDAVLTMNGKRVSVASSGRFSHTLSNLSGETDVKIISKDPTGNVSELDVIVARLTEDQLYDFNIGKASALQSNRVKAGSTIISSKAYNGLKVIISNQQQSRTIATDGQGRWGTKITFIPGELIITFKDVSTDQTYLTKTFIVEADQ